MALLGPDPAPYMRMAKANLNSSVSSWRGLPPYLRGLRFAGRLCVAIGKRIEAWKPSCG